MPFDLEFVEIFVCESYSALEEVSIVVFNTDKLQTLYSDCPSTYRSHGRCDTINSGVFLYVCQHLFQVGHLALSLNSAGNLLIYLLAGIGHLTETDTMKII
jgi:hypothetical protein